MHLASKHGWCLQGDSLQLWAFQGIRRNDNDINQWLPEFEADYDYPIVIPDGAIEFADKYVQELRYNPIIFHISWRSVDTKQVGQHWSLKSFYELARLIYAHTGEKILLVGRDFEDNLVSSLVTDFSSEPFIKLTGKTSVAQLYALINRSKLIFGFQSGATFLGIHAKTPSVLLWPIENVSNVSSFRYKRKFMTSFTPPEATNKWYFPCVLGEEDPETIWKKIKDIL